jgi:multidrug efflux system membrane fusion protein
MKINSNSTVPKRLSRLISTGIVAVAVALGLAVLYSSNYYPRTDDAEVFANFIGIAPQVEGPITRLNARDNQFVKQGDAQPRAHRFV